MFKLFPVSCPGHLPVHHQTAKGTGRHQEPTVQQILLPVGGEELKLVFLLMLVQKDSTQAADEGITFLCALLEPCMGEVLQYMFRTGGLQRDLHPALQDSFLCHQVRPLLKHCCVLLRKNSLYLRLSHCFVSTN